MQRLALACRLLVTVLIAGLAGCITTSPTVHREAEEALGPYSGSVSAGGLCFVSGKGGNPHSTFAGEVAGAIDAIEKELVRAGLGLADIVSVTIYLTDMSFYEEMNAVYGSKIPKPHPARTCVAVASLPGDFRVEIQAVARHR